jgi:cytochrome c
MRLMKPLPAAALAAGLFAAATPAQLTTYPGCADLASTDFVTEELFNKTGVNAPLATNSGLSEPVQFDVQGVMNQAGDSTLYTNAYIVERKGKVKFYDGLAKRVDSVGFIPNWAYQSNRNNDNDNGLMGIALDPDFKANKWIYFWYSPTIPEEPATGADGLISGTKDTITNRYNRRLRLSRITVNAENKLNMSTEKILIDILGSKVDDYHAGGPMTFDREGNLLVTIGNNSKDLTTGPGPGNQYSTTDSSHSGEWGSSNTASLRGGVIRIRPDNNANAVHVNRSGTYGPGYTIPAGNFGEYWGSYFQSQGNATLAAEYRDTAKVRPEVYVKGTRSNYSIAVHPTKGWVGWGDVQYSTTNDEYNLIDHPVFAGMPYFQKNNQATPAGSFVLPAGHSAATPINNSPLNSGVKNLPPAQMPLIWYAASATPTTSTMPNNVAIGGPIYVYNRNLKSSVKFPPHLNHTWILMTTYGDPTSGGMWIAKLDSVTPAIAEAPQRQATTGVLRFTIRNPIQAKYGPDGALYTLFYGSTGAYGSGNNPGLIRTTYTGSCKLPPVSLTAPRPLSELRMTLRGSSLRILEPGQHEVALLAVDGRALFRMNGAEGAEYSLDRPAGAQGGIYLLQVKTARGVFSRSLALF